MRRSGIELCLVGLTILLAAILPVRALPQGGTAALKDYQETIRSADSLAEAGDYFEAVRLYERAGRVAYNNKLVVDKSALETKLAAARQKREGKKSAAPGPSAPAAPVVASFVELTTPLATGPRQVTSRTVPQDHRFGPSDEASHWVVSNPFLPVDRKFLEKIFQMACGPEGSIYLAGGSLVSAVETGRQPIGNKGYYAENGSGIWRVAPGGAVTAFAVRPNGYMPGWDHRTARCNSRIADTDIDPTHWGGMVVDGSGNLLVSDSELHLILKFTPSGMVEHVAGGGPQACAYDRWKTPQKSGYQDGTGAEALFKQPAGLALDPAGNLLVADAGNCALRRIDKSGQVTTIRKGCSSDAQKPNDYNTAIWYDFLAVDPEGRAVVAASRLAQMNEFSNVFRIYSDGRAEQLLAGRKFGPRTEQQRLNYLGGLAVLPTGAVLVADGFDQGSRLYELRQGRLVPFAGLGGVDMQESEIDGPAAKARIRQTGGFCVTPDGTLFLRPSIGGHPVRKIEGPARTVSSWAY